ncbi:MAG: DUF1801 domain-containing protein [Gammaproteobacteria bacterium]|nr:DUF1801 domain-containing protein [Gammaproteobacteria bacterium]
MTFILSVAEPITAAIDAIVHEVCPGAGRRTMYGGIVFELEPGNHKTLVCGHFVYKKHVSLEFSKGKLLRDPDGVLEGGGKYRRHIKLRQLADIQEKSVRSIIEQAFALPVDDAR